MGVTVTFVNVICRFRVLNKPFPCPKQYSYVRLLLPFIPDSQTR